MLYEVITKLLYPVAALVMLALALPFAYMHTRAGMVGVKVFLGIMLGVLFHMLNNLFAHVITSYSIHYTKLYEPGLRHCDEPLIGEHRLDHRTGTPASRHHHAVRLDLV